MTHNQISLLFSCLLSEADVKKETQSQPQRCIDYYHWTSMFGEIWSVIVSRIYTLQITDMADSHRIKITDVLCNYYKLPEVHM